MFLFYLITCCFLGYYILCGCSICSLFLLKDLISGSIKCIMDESHEWKVIVKKLFSKFIKVQLIITIH